MGLGERVSAYMSHESVDADGSTITAVHELKDETVPTFYNTVHTTNGYGSTYPSPLRFGAWGNRKLQGQGVGHPLKGLSARKPRPPLP